MIIQVTTQLLMLGHQPKVHLALRLHVLIRKDQYRLESWMYYPYLVIGPNIQLDGSQGLLGDSLCVQGLIFCIAKATFHVRKLEGCFLSTLDAQGIEGYEPWWPTGSSLLDNAPSYRSIGQIAPGYPCPSWLQYGDIGRNPRW